MVRFDDLALFVRTAALGSFSNAAREADLLPGQVAAAVARMPSCAARCRWRRHRTWAATCCCRG